MAPHAMGDATKNEINTRITKSLDSNDVMPVTEAPSTFRMPISLMRFSAEKQALPSFAHS